MKKGRTSRRSLVLQRLRDQLVRGTKQKSVDEKPKQLTKKDIKRISKEIEALEQKLESEKY